MVLYDVSMDSVYASAHLQAATAASFELVVCRFAEDVSWTSPWSAHTTIYNKGLDDLTLPCVLTPNVGREGETYLRHIIARHPHFPAVTVFAQGRVDDHCDMPTVARILDGLAQQTGGEGYVGLSSLWGNIVDGTDAYGDPGPEMWRRVFGGPPPAEVPVNYNGIFAVSAGRLAARPKIFYEAALREVELLGPPGGHALERLWTPMFSGSLLG